MTDDKATDRETGIVSGAMRRFVLIGASARL